ncbi:MAG: peroxiredoxin [Planctomycetota bacterium]|nr:MAG: peroxiredoxin [Planctomycetota bacterium]
MAPINPGRKAPDFTLPDQDGRPFKLSDHEDKAIVLFFYPKDCTSACTIEAKDFSDLRAKFRKAGAEVVGVSILGTASKQKFAQTAGLKIPLLADDRKNDAKKPDPEIAQKYGVWGEKSMYGRTYMGIIRTTYLIGPGRKVVKRWDKVDVPNHAEEVLEQVKALGLDPIPSR